MLSLLKIQNIALIDDLRIEFQPGLNLLTGETGSGKSIIVDSLAALTGERVYSDLVKEGENAALIEGVFTLDAPLELREIFDEGGVDLEGEDETDIIVRREISLGGRNRIFVNNQPVTQSFLKKVGPFLVDIHGQGEQAAIFSPATHLDMLDEYAAAGDLRTAVRDRFEEMNAVAAELGQLAEDEAQKLQLIDILQFQVAEIKPAGLEPGEDDRLEEEKRRLNNAEKLSALSAEAYSLLYEDETAAGATLERAARRVEELAQYDSRFSEYTEALRTSAAVIEDLAFAVRDFRSALEFSPERLAGIDDRLAEMARLKRKYGGTIESVLAHLEEAEGRLLNIETAELREKELGARLAALRAGYVEAAAALHDKRRESAARFEKEVEKALAAVALEKARFEVRIDSPPAAEIQRREIPKQFTASGYDRVEFHFSANPGESVKPVGKVASGGEASRLMLVLKTTARLAETKKAMVFDEIDAGIGGRIAESVGLRLKDLAASQQVLCVTHQAQIASLADCHFRVEKESRGKRTVVAVRKLGASEKVEEIARMLAGEKISETARRHASELLAARK